MDCAFCSDRDIVDCSSRNWSFVGCVFEAQLGFRRAEVLDVERRKAGSSLLADDVAEFTPGKVDLKR